MRSRSRTKKPKWLKERAGRWGMAGSTKSQNMIILHPEEVPMKALRLLLAALCVAAAPPTGAQTKLKFAIFTPDKEQTFLTVMKPWAEAVNKDAGGTIEVELFPNGALGRSPLQQAQMVLDGVADIAWVIAS